MKTILSSLLFLAMCATPALASGPHHHPGKMNHSTSKGHKGKMQKKHQKHSGKWKGGKKKHWHKGMKSWISWSPTDSCWYRYDADTDTYEPCEDLTDEDIDD
jgi:hypothetical protein